MRIPETKKLPTKYQRPAVKERVRVTRYPIIKGPTKPPKLPTELIKPIDAAAADSLRNSGGTAYVHAVKECNDVQHEEKGQ